MLGILKVKMSLEYPTFETAFESGLHKGNDNGHLCIWRFCNCTDNTRVHLWAVCIFGSQEALWATRVGVGPSIANTSIADTTVYSTTSSIGTASWDICDWDHYVGVAEHGARMVARCCAGGGVARGVRGLGCSSIWDQCSFDHTANGFTGIVCTGAGCRRCGGGASTRIKQVDETRHNNRASAGSGCSHAITRSINWDGLGSKWWSYQCSWCEWCRCHCRAQLLLVYTWH